MIITFVIAIIIGINYKSSVVSSSNLIFVFTILFAIELGCATIFVLDGGATDSKCILQPILGGLAFVILFGAILAKLIRIFRVDSDKLMNTIKTPELLMTIGAVVGVEVIILIIWMSVERPVPTVIKSEFDSDSILKCTSTNRWIFSGIMIGYEALLVVISGVLIYLIRNRHTKVLWNESRFIVFTVYNLALWGTIGLVIGEVFEDIDILSFAILAVCILLTAVGTLIFLYFTKIYFIYIAKVLDKRNSLPTPSVIQTDFKLDDIQSL